MPSANRYFSLFLFLLLTACGGGDPVVSGDSDGGDSQTPDGSDSTGDSLMTYFPLQFYLQGSGYVEEELFLGISFTPQIHGYLIAPVNVNTLEPVASPDVSEFTITINEEPIQPVEQGLVMQPLLGLDVDLYTLLLIDTSASTQPVNKTALINEIKDFIQQAQSSADPAIRNQRFAVATFAGDVQVLQGIYTRDAATLNAALDNLANNWPSASSGTALYKAIVQGIGSYIGPGNAGGSEDDFTTDGLQDVIETYTQSSNVVSGIRLANTVVFTPGGNTPGKYNFEDAQSALNWQSLLVFSDSETEGSSAPEGMAYSGKPLLYVSIGETDVESQKLAADVLPASYSNFDGIAEGLIRLQQSKVISRVHKGNQYLVRFARLLTNDGEYELVFSSNTASRNYSLTSKLVVDTSGGAIPTPQPAVEITGPKSAYLVANEVSASEANKLYPATRWTVQSYNAGNYSWSVGGVPRASAADGSITISASDAGSTVTLTNTSLSATASVLVTP
ncbi:vWA domain-containing protein [Bacterioplanoides pacificum]|uniref:VWA domain-containing protein n=1 Tax=Bacterioplanoides pacificum TaxID=1171596 RepID=A0ABV7VSM6_9GAMM